MNSKSEILKYGSIAGLAAGFAMFVPMMILTKGLGVAPFQMPPSAALLVSFDFPPIPGGPILHFLYGVFWAVLFFAYFKQPYTLKQALGLSLLMWILMQVVMAPLIGWGLFGTGAANLDGTPLALGSTPKYLLVTVVFHLIYGVVLGLIAKWFNRSQQTEKASA